MCFMPYSQIWSRDIRKVLKDPGRHGTIIHAWLFYHMCPYCMGRCLSCSVSCDDNIPWRLLAIWPYSTDYITRKCINPQLCRTTHIEAILICHLLQYRCPVLLLTLCDTHSPAYCCTVTGISWCFCGLCDDFLSLLFGCSNEVCPMLGNKLNFNSKLKWLVLDTQFSYSRLERITEIKSTQENLVRYTVKWF
jgi:hypothetical protein